jgi:endonuclease/exonuclease/phosphatase (EEP) superfamily protein YafD
MQRIRRLVVFVAYAYPLALLAAILFMRYGGQRFWQAELALYLPRLGFALPLPLLVPLLLVLRQRRALWSQLVAAWIVVFPMMGLTLPGWPSSPDDPKKTLRVLSYNANFLYSGADAVATQIRALAPDVVVMQQMAGNEELQAKLAGSYSAFASDGEFLVASRYPVRSQWRPPSFHYVDRLRTTRSMRYEIDTNLGRIALYSFHPVSPSHQMTQVRSGGLRRAIASGQLFSLAPRPETEHDTGLRRRQVAAVARLAKREKLPVILAGDTNLPKLSAALSELADFQDGFEEAGSGFGYTFPNKLPWMRIDRIFASEQLRFLDFEVGTMRASDHHCVVATLELAR